VNPLDLAVKGIFAYHFLNLEGECVIKVQSMEELIQHALCFDKDGNLIESIYSEIVDESKAINFASKELGLTDLRPAENETMNIDPYIAEDDNGRLEVVRYQGNQEGRHCTYQTQDQIVECILRSLAGNIEYNFENTLEVIQRMLNIADKNYDVSVDSNMDQEAFMVATAMYNSNNITTHFEMQYVEKNEFGSPNLPPLIERVLPDGTTVFLLSTGEGSVIRRGPLGFLSAILPLELLIPREANFIPIAEKTPGGSFNITAGFGVRLPGFGNMSHMRYLAEAHRYGSLGNWEKIPQFKQIFDMIDTGMQALDRITCEIQKILSLDNIPNLFFRPGMVPYYQRPVDDTLKGLVAFQQDVVQGVRYPVGIRRNGGDDIPGEPAAGRAAGRRAGAPVAVSPDTLEEWLEQMGFPADDGEFALTKQDQREITRSFFNFGDDKLGNLLANTNTVQGQIRWKSEYEASWITKSRFGKYVASWPLMAALIWRELNKNDSWASADNTRRGQILAGTLSQLSSSLSEDTASHLRDVEYDIREGNMAESFVRTIIGVGLRKVPESEPFVQSTEESVHSYVNARLTISPKYWDLIHKRSSSASGDPKGVFASQLRPVDPAHPLTDFLGEFVVRPDIEGNWPRLQPGENVWESVKPAARAKAAGVADMGMCAVDPHTRKLSEDPVASRNVRPRMSAGARVSGFRHAGASASASVDTSDYTTFRDGPPQYGFITPETTASGAMHTSMDFTPNQHWKQKWHDVMRFCRQSFIRRTLHIAFMGMPINAHVLCNMARRSIPPPICVMPADPYIDFQMTSGIFLKSGADTGYLRYALNDISVGHNSDYKLINIHLTGWLGSIVQRIENVFVVDHLAFHRYLRGGDGELVKNPRIPNQPNRNCDFAYNNIKRRHANRFVLYAGASFQSKDMPDPLPLSGSYAKSSYAGTGIHFDEDGLGGRNKKGPLYPSAIVCNMRAGFYLVNKSVPQGEDDASFDDRCKVASKTYNTLLGRANQWGPNFSTESIKRRVWYGTSALGPASENIGQILNGSPGLISAIVKDNDEN
jgi:hypothetical protein